MNINTDFYLVEDFVSLEGEGLHTGTPTYFIRLAGCNVHCVFCDTKELQNIMH